MSRLDELKKQYPELNMTLFDVLVRLDATKTYKYLPLFCKIFGEKFDLKYQYQYENIPNIKLEIEANLINKGISTNNLTDNQIYTLHTFSEYFLTDTFFTMKEFMEYMEKGIIENKDVTSYGKIDDIRSAITLASMKEFTKELEGQIINEYEDDTWISVRPLTFASSAKYGANTRWCTTYKKEKNYFERYWRNGILVYFINKKTGYKFAGYKGVQGDREFSFWNAEDTRIDYLNVEADDYLFPIVKRIFSSDQTNKNLSSDSIQEQVHIECVADYEKMRIVERIEIAEQPIREQPTEITTEEVDMNFERRLGRFIEQMEVTEPQIRELRAEMTFNDVPTMSA